MKFYNWMVRKHLRTKALVGELARAMQLDRQFPKDGDRASIRNILRTLGQAVNAWMHLRRHGESMREKQVEQKLVSEVKRKGAASAQKFVSPGFDGMPDRIVLLPGRVFRICGG